MFGILQRGSVATGCSGGFVSVPGNASVSAQLFYDRPVNLDPIEITVGRLEISKDRDRGIIREVRLRTDRSCHQNLMRFFPVAVST